MRTKPNKDKKISFLSCSMLPSLSLHFHTYMQPLHICVTHIFISLTNRDVPMSLTTWLFFSIHLFKSVLSSWLVVFDSLDEQCRRKELVEMLSPLAHSAVIPSARLPKNMELLSNPVRRITPLFSVIYTAFCCWAGRKTASSRENASQLSGWR